MNEITIDHIIPIDRGGTSAFSNLLPACKRCNSRKGNKVIHEYDFEYSKQVRKYVKKFLNNGMRVPCTSVLYRYFRKNNSKVGKLTIHHIRCKEIFKYKNKFFIDNL